MQKYKVYINNEVKVFTDNFDDFIAKHSLVEAAGGLVYNNHGQLLMIFRNGKWDLPKGKIEFSEDVQTCAIREVEEECGVSDLNIVRELESTYHTFSINGVSFLKRTYWFMMKTSFSFELTPQISEGITRVEWVNNKDISLRLDKSFPSIKFLVLSIK